MTARPFRQRIPRRLRAKHGVSSRAVSAILADAGSAFLLFKQNSLGPNGAATLSLRQHFVSVIQLAFSIVDLFATDIANQRPRRRRLNLALSAD